MPTVIQKGKPKTRNFIGFPVNPENAKYLEKVSKALGIKSHGATVNFLITHLRQKNYQIIESLCESTTVN